MTPHDESKSLSETYDTLSRGLSWSISDVIVDSRTGAWLCSMPSYCRVDLFTIVIVVVFLITGTANTLFAKWADRIYANGTNPTASHVFDHPFYQANLMFIGELLCLFAFEASLYFTTSCGNGIPEEKRESASSTTIVWIIPALCDLVGTSLGYIGLQLTSASSFQMLRGSVIIFTGVLARLILKTKLRIRQWIGMVTIVIGLITVGSGDYWHHNKTSNSDVKWHAVIGDALIIVSQLLTAFQVIIEEKFLRKFNVDPLKAVGWEGLFGFIIMVFIYIPLYYIHWHYYIPNIIKRDTPHTHLEDVADAITQMLSSSHLLIACIGVVLSIALYNFAGLTVTRKWNAASRIVLDSIRTIFIWAISISLPNWQKAQPFQPVGYLILIVGTFIYYDIIFMPFIRWVIRKYTANGNDVYNIQGEQRSLLVESVSNTQVLSDDSTNQYDARDDGNLLYARASRI